MFYFYPKKNFLQYTLHITGISIGILKTEKALTSPFQHSQWSRHLEILRRFTMDIISHGNAQNSYTVNMYMYIYMYIHIHTVYTVQYIYVISIYIHFSREREP